MISLLWKGGDKAAGRGLEAGLVGAHCNSTHKRGWWPGTAEVVEDWANGVFWTTANGIQRDWMDGRMDKKSKSKMSQVGTSLVV